MQDTVVEMRDKHLLIGVSLKRNVATHTDTNQYLNQSSNLLWDRGKIRLFVQTAICANLYNEYNNISSSFRKLWIGLYYFRRNLPKWNGVK